MDTPADSVGGRAASSGYESSRGSAFLAVDLGTTSIKAGLFGERGERLALAEAAAPLKRTAASRGGPSIELDFDEVWNQVCGVVRSVADDAGVAIRRTRAFGLSSQAQTFAPMNSHSRPIQPGISWLDERAEKEKEEIEEAFGRREFYQASGFNEVSPCLLACKLLWFRRHQPEIWRSAARFALLRDYILFRLTGRWVTEFSLLGIGGLYHLVENRLWNEMLEFLSIPTSNFGDLVRGDQSIGGLSLEASQELGFPEGIPVVPGMLDQICAAIGLGNDSPGTISENSGTCMTVFATTPTVAPEALMRLPFGRHVVEGWGFFLPYLATAGNVLEWFLYRITAGSNLETLEREAAEIPPGCEGVRMIPHFSGVHSPEANLKVRGHYAGLELRHNRAHLYRACLESLAFGLRENIEMLQPHLEHLPLSQEGVISLPANRDGEIAPKENMLVCGGGGAASDLWLQIKSDVLGRPVFAPSEAECSLLGAAILARLAACEEPLWQACRRMVRRDTGRIFRPRNTSAYQTAYEDYLRLSRLAAEYAEGGKRRVP